MTLNLAKAPEMRTNGHIQLRYFHSLSANFTLPIQRRPITAVLLPFSLKRVSEKEVRNTHERSHVRALGIAGEHLDGRELGLERRDQPVGGVANRNRDRVWKCRRSRSRECARRP